MAPATQKQWSVQNTEQDFDSLKFEDAQVPTVGENEVLVKLHAASLNYRDLIIPKGNLLLVSYLKYAETDGFVC